MSRSFKIKIIRGTDLKAADLNGKSDPYVKVFLEKKGSKPSELYKTKTIKKTLNPEWNEEFEIVVPADQRELFYDYHVKFDVYDKDLIGKDFLGTAIFNFGYCWTSTMPANKEIPIKLPLRDKGGFLHLSLTFVNQGHMSLAEHIAKQVPEGFKRVDLKSYNSVGTVVIPSDFEVQSSPVTLGKRYILNATKTTDGRNSSLFIVEQDGALYTPSCDHTLLKYKVDTIIDMELKKDWNWCGTVEKFKIDDENGGLCVGYRSASKGGDVFTTKSFFYILGSNNFFTLTHSFTVKPVEKGLTQQDWVTYSQEQLAHAKTSVLNILIDSLKIYPASAEVEPL